MSYKKIIVILVFFVAIFPFYHSNFIENPNVNLEFEAGYISPPAEAKEYHNGLKYIVLKTGEENSSKLPIVRSSANIWAEDGTQISNMVEGGLSTDDPKDLEASHPFLAEILKATPVGGHYQWWVESSQISEATPGFEVMNHYIEIKIKDHVAPLAPPIDVAGIPDYATVTDDGIGYYLLGEASDGEHPTLNHMVEVHYSGWQTDGTMFDSSILREKTNIFPLGRLIAGWQKSIPLMRVGEKARIWIPGDLAYDLREDRPFAPKGMLVFDVELFSISPNPDAINDVNETE